MAGKRKAGSMYGPRSKYTRRSAPSSKAGKKTLSAAVRKAVYGLAEKKRQFTHINEETLSSIGQGSNSWNLITPVSNSGNSVNRVGQEITLDRFEFRGVLHNNAATNNMVRILVGYVKDTALFTSASQLFENANGFGAAVSFSSVNNLDSIYWPINKVKFTPILDRVYTLAPTSSVDAGNVKSLVYSIRLKKKIKFEGTDAGQDGQDTNLFMIAWTGEAGDDATIGTNVEISGLARVLFTDL